MIDGPFSLVQRFALAVMVSVCSAVVIVGALNVFPVVAGWEVPFGIVAAVAIVLAGWQWFLWVSAVLVRAAHNWYGDVSYDWDEWVANGVGPLAHDGMVNGQLYWLPRNDGDVLPWVAEVWLFEAETVGDWVILHRSRHANKADAEFEMLLRSDEADAFPEYD